MTLMVSLVCRGPLMVSPVTKLMRTHGLVGRPCHQYWLQLVVAVAGSL